MPRFPTPAHRVGGAYPDNGTVAAPSGATVTPKAAHATHGWGDLNQAVATTLPTALFNAAQLDLATRRLLRRRGRVR
jgi:hypothetical protein